MALCSSGKVPYAYLRMYQLIEAIFWKIVSNERSRQTPGIARSTRIEADEAVQPLALQMMDGEAGDRELRDTCCARLGRLSAAIAVATRLRCRLLQFPEHPDEGRAQAYDDTQEHQCQSRGCEHVQHP